MDRTEVEAALVEASRALDDVVRYFDGRMPPAGFPLASTVKPAADRVRAALDTAPAPQSEDHETGKWAARIAGHEAFDAAAARERVTIGEAINAVSDAAIAAYLSRVSPSAERDPDDMSAEERIEMLIRERDHAQAIVDSFQRSERDTGEAGR